LFESHEQWLLILAQNRSHADDSKDGNWNILNRTNVFVFPCLLSRHSGGRSVNDTQDSKLGKLQVLIHVEVWQNKSLDEENRLYSSHLVSVSWLQHAILSCMSSERQRRRKEFVSLKAMENMLDTSCTNMDMKLGGCTANSSYRCKEACTQIPEQHTVMF